MSITEGFEVRGDTSHAQAAMKKLEGAITGGFLKANIALKVFDVAMSAAVSLMKDGFQAAVDLQKTTRLLSDVLRVNNKLVAESNALLEAQSNVLEQQTGIGQESIRTMQARSIALGVDVAQVDKFMRAAIGLANVTGRNVNEIVNQLGKSLSGVADETLRTIPGVKDLTQEQLKQGAAIELVAKQYGSLATITTSNDFQGALTRTQTSLGNIAKEAARAVTESKWLSDELENLAGKMHLLEKNAQGVIDIGFIGVLQVWMAELTNSTEQVWHLSRAIKALEANEAALKAKRDEDWLNLVARFERQDKEDARAAAAAAKRKADLAELRRKQREYNLEITQEAEFRIQAEQANKLTGAIAGPTGPGTSPVINAAKQIEDAKTRILADGVAARADLANQEQELWMIAYGNIQGAVQTFTGTTIQALELMIEGTGATSKEYAKALMGGIGKGLVAQGISHMLQAGAFAFIPGMQGNAAGLAAAAGIELTAGAAMMAGNLALASKGVGGLGSAAKDRETAKNQSAAGTGGGGGFAPRGRSAAGGGETTQTVVVNFHGPTTRAEVGVAIKEALAEANAMGM